MSWNDEVDRAFARRRGELVQELIEEGKRVVDDVGRIASACAAEHPLAHVGSGIVAGACMTLFRGAPSVLAAAPRSGLLRGALLALLGAATTAESTRDPVA